MIEYFPKSPDGEIPATVFAYHDVLTSERFLHKRTTENVIEDPYINLLADELINSSVEPADVGMMKLASIAIKARVNYIKKVLTDDFADQVAYLDYNAIETRQDLAKVQPIEDNLADVPDFWDMALIDLIYRDDNLI